MSSNGDPIIFVESPVASALVHRATGLQTVATYGHIFNYEYENNRLSLKAKNNTLIQEISRFNTLGQSMIIATDDDPQGDLIALHLRSLTPLANHKRTHLNALTGEGIRAAVKTRCSFNDAHAAQGAYIRLLNLKLRLRGRSHYLTTTGITLAKSFLKRGRLNKPTAFTLEHNGQQFYTGLPKHQLVDSLEVMRPSAANTRQVAMLAAMHGIEGVHQQLQELYQSQRLSYVRTESDRLPASNAIYENHTNALGQHEAHTAIHNLVPFQDSLERFVYKLNETATNGQCHVLSVKTDIGNMLALDEPFPTRDLSPTCETLLHLALDPDTFASTIGKSSVKYASYFFNKTLNTGLINKTLTMAHQIVPEVVDRGIKHTIQTQPLMADNHLEETMTLVEQHPFKTSERGYFPLESDISHTLV